MNLEAHHLLAALFLPLFPLSMVFGALFGRFSNRWLRLVMLLLWPQAGVWLLAGSTLDPPGWLQAWALLTALFYGFRALALREAGLWIGFIAISSGSLIWLLLDAGYTQTELHWHALGLTAPLILLSQISADIERRLGAAYTGLSFGLAERTPRLAGLLVVTTLAAMATPMFPGFFTLLDMVTLSASAAPIMALGLLLLWLLWSWSGARLIQGLIIGQAEGQEGVADLATPHALLYALLLAALAVAGMISSGGLS
ncbi:MAG: hypothetical protein ACPG4N_01995 [Gammaproteobacteria bacterium]